MRILLLEDDLQLGKALQAALAMSEFEAIWVRRVADARMILGTETFSVVLLDIGLPDGSGLDVLRWLRETRNNVPVIMLTARDAVDDRILGLNAGADDYMPKPFAVPELLSRIRAIHRRSLGFTQELWRIGQLSIEPSKYKVSVAGVPVHLSDREYTLLLELARCAGKYVTRESLEGVLFKSETVIESNALEVHMHKLRKKLGIDCIRTIRGVGYLLEDQS